MNHANHKPDLNRRAFLKVTIGKVAVLNACHRCYQSL